MNVVALLREARGRERAQSAFYRALAAEAEAEGRADAAERLNGLLADEQHHVSRITARLLELGVALGDEVRGPAPPPLEDWEDEARKREADEVRWYEEALDAVQDAEARRIFGEILESERRHRDELGGKWMSASSGGAEDGS